jgi:hypothetical protein
MVARNKQNFISCRDRIKRDYEVVLTTEVHSLLKATKYGRLYADPK